MYHNIRNYDIRYLDVDFNEELRLSSLMSVLEESACASADELGFGYDDIMPKNIGFVIVNWYLEQYRPIKLKEKLTVHTWPMKPKRTAMFREFEVYSGNEKVAVGTSRWCMVDLKSFALLPTSAFFGILRPSTGEIRSMRNSLRSPTTTTISTATIQSMRISVSTPSPLRNLPAGA